MRQLTGSHADLRGHHLKPSSINSRGFPMSLVRELWRFMRVRKKFWLLPIFVVMFVLGGLLILAKGSAIAPFIYTIF